MTVALGTTEEFNTKQNTLSHPSTLKSRLLYIKHHVSEIHLDSYMFFFFFFLGLYHILRSFINELAACLHHKTCLSVARA